MSALVLAANNGHVRCEKRIWLFNWNMDALSEMDNNKISTGKEEYEVNDAAKRYHEQYQR